LINERKRVEYCYEIESKIEENAIFMEKQV